MILRNYIIRINGAVDKVDDSESGGPGSNLDTAIWEKSACAVGKGTLPKVVLDNDHLLFLDYEFRKVAMAP